MSKKFLTHTLSALVLLSFVGPAGAIALGQLDDFQDGTTALWTNGGGIALPVVNIATGGPAGAGDRYIQVTATSQTAPRLTTFNRNQWLGDYIAAGVTAIEFDLINQGSVTLSIRLAFKTDTSQASSGYLSLPVILAPGSGWQHFSISITAANLTALFGPAAYNTFFQNGFAELRIINEAGSLNLNGDPVVGQLGIDNIRAVPEPTITMLALGGLLVIGGRLLRRRRQKS